MAAPSIIGGADRKRLLARVGVSPALHIIRADGQKSQDSQQTTQLDSVVVHRGFYRIVQKVLVTNAQGDDEYQDLDAATTVPSGATEFPVKMQEAQQLIDQVWYLNPEYGVKKGYSIVPAITPGVDSPLGGTAYDSNDNVVVKRSSCYPIWVVSCDEIITYETEDQIQSINYFRISEVGTVRCWKTKTDHYVEVKDKSKLVPIPPRELYEILPCPSLLNIVVNSVNSISVTADDNQVQRRLWFSSSTITKQALPAYVSTQLTTDSRDQGWANYPDAGLWSWFEIALLKGPTTPEAFDLSKIKTRKDGTLLTFVSHRLAIDADYKEQTGHEFGRAEELWTNFEEGNVFGVLACAQFRAWNCEARSGKLDFKVVLPPPPA